MTLQQIGLQAGTDKATYHNYLEFYQKYLPDRSFTGRLLEIGVMHGASLRMWKEYYPKADIVAIDINLGNYHDKVEGTTTLQMDATDIEALKTLGDFDIIVDDGSHMTSHQQSTYNHLYNNQLNNGGLYVMEDLHTSFWANYIDSPKTTYDVLKDIPGVLKYHGNDNQSITFIIPK